jgi:hypothetical protein
MTDWRNLEEGQIGTEHGHWSASALITENVEKSFLNLISPGCEKIRISEKRFWI